MLLSPPSPCVSSIASRYHPLVALNPPYHRVLFSGVSRSPISYYSRWIPFHIRQPSVPPSSFLSVSFSSFFSFFFFFDIKLAIVHVLSALYGHRCRWNIEILRTCISFLSPLSVTLSKTRSLNGSQVLMTCRASSWSWIYGPIFHGENWNCGFQCRPQPMTGFTPRNVRITFASLFVCDVTFARYRRILATRRGWKFEAEFLALKPLWYCSYEGERWMHTFGLSSLVIVLL